jgi:hypothetical protein
MTDKVQFKTEISEETREQWNAFVRNRHHSLKGSTGPELEITMINHMKSYYDVDDNDAESINNNTLEKLKIIANGFRGLPKPTLKPTICRGFIKKLTKCKDSRTLEKYVKIVMDHSKTEINEDEVFPLVNISGFCGFVDTLVQNNILDKSSK